MMEIPVTLSSVVIATLIALWLSIRVGQMRGKTKTIHGDDGGGPLTRRMRAHLNYVENTPLVLLLILVIELAGRTGLWLSIVAAVYFLGRVLHAIGMDGEGPTKPRMIGVLITMLTMLGLAIYAALIWFGVV
ncbi:MAPEG family protein [Altererythrobacter sp. MF3-039]|uniref:MAPEG family protein n=1 Tax=Altererythrobacter sp. MF3-039 TaxID=3252901 RepID=UPI00390C7327